MDYCVSNLIKCQKIISKKPRIKMYHDKQNQFILRNDFECKSICGKYIFYVFMRKSIIIEDLFSVGLRLESAINEEGKKEALSLILYRCNGKHEHQNKVINNEKFDSFHIHTLDDRNFSMMRDNILDAEVTKAYDNFHDALIHFLDTCNILDYENFFVLNEQLQFEGM